MKLVFARHQLHLDENRGIAAKGIDDFDEPTIETIIYNRLLGVNFAIGTTDRKWNNWLKVCIDNSGNHKALFVRPPNRRT
jgi:hypothetical protein